MTQKPNRAPEVVNFLAIAATSPSLRNAGVREATAGSVAKRVVHTSLIDAEWAPLSVTREAHRSGARQIFARPPHTSLIDADWDLQPFALVDDEAEACRIFARPPHTSLIDADWDPQPVVEELDPVITFVELDGPECLFDLDF
jgi:hypothetical protein